MRKVWPAIVKKDAEISMETTEFVIGMIKASLEDGDSVFVADNFRMRDEENRPCSIDVESRVSGRCIDTVIFFSRSEAIFWRRMFPILRKVIFITDKEETTPEGEDGIIIINEKDVTSSFKKFIV
jgi:hypothetical protein